VRQLPELRKRVRELERQMTAARAQGAVPAGAQADGSRDGAEDRTG
jgi:hypothetical protein